jgi:RNA polymerase sigma-70 factor (ECF subfamily)
MLLKYDQPVVDSKECRLSIGAVALIAQDEPEVRNEGGASLCDRNRHCLMTREDDDTGLVARVAAGDREAYRALVDKYQGRAYAIAFDIVRTREDAEDVVQESFVKAYLSIAQFKGQSSFYTWFYRIVYNMAIDFKRKLSRREHDSISFDDTTSPTVLAASGANSQTGEDILSRKEQARRIQDVLEGISEEHRTVLMLREIDGLNYDEISKVVGVTRGTVMSRLHYARKKLQKALADLVGGTSKGETEKGSEAASGTPTTGYPVKGMRQ